MEEDDTVEVQFRKFGIAEAFTCHFRPKRSHAGKPLRFCETGVSCLRSFLQDRPCITGTEEAKRLFKNYWKQHPANDQEQFVIACLDTKHRVQCVVRITVGTLDASLVHPREVFKPALIEGSAAILLSHNHPSGNPEPSREDIQVTERLTEAGKILGISVLDHIIHGDGTGEVKSIREN